MPSISVTYNSASKVADLTWNASQDAAVAGYVIRLMGNGIDSVVALRFSDENSLTIPGEQPEGMFVAIMSYDTNGVHSCWADVVPIVVSDVKRDYASTRSMEAIVLPNPVRRNASLYLKIDEGGRCENFDLYYFRTGDQYDHRLSR